MNNLFNEAISFAVEKHKNQKRKGTDWPYVVHLYDVMKILQQNEANLETIIAGILHDTVEDTDTTLEEIEQKFGTNIKNMVDILSENKSLPYTERKLLQAKRLQSANIQTKMIKCADCLSNLSAIKYDLAINKNAWNKFNAPKEKIQIHYSETIKAMSNLEDFEMYKELKSIFSEVFSQNLIQKAIKQHDYTNCNFMERHLDPDSDDWFCDDDQKYVCGITKKVLSYANRPYEKQPTPSDCPILNK